MENEKVTPNDVRQITGIASRAASEKNQQSAPAAGINAGQGAADAGDGNDDGCSAKSVIASAAMHVSNCTDGQLVASPGHLSAQPATSQASATLIRLLHEDGGGKAAAPPQYAQQLAVLCDEGHTLAHWAARYMAIKVCGRSPNTVAAKARDLASFVGWFVKEHGGEGVGSGAGEISRWIERDTRRYLQFLASRGRKPATINRALCTLKHFAGWVHGQPGGVFMRYGLPVLEVQMLSADEPDCKKMSPQEVNAVFAAAQAATTLRPGRGPGSRYRPRRNLAILALLYYTGVRVTEALGLKRQQYDGSSLYGVKCKGHRVREIELHPDCARLVDDYLQHERPWDNGEEGNSLPDAARPLFLNRDGTAIGRRSVARIFEDLAKGAGEDAALSDGDGNATPVHLHPHRLRHTFGSLYREASGSDTETAAALGHSTMRYVGRYVRKTKQERRDVLGRAFGRAAVNNADAAKP